MFNLNKQEFFDLYKNTKIVNYPQTFFSEPKNDEDLVKNYIPSKLWRLNNLYKIINKEGNLVKFSMNKSQHYVYSKLLIHPRQIILKSRQQGVSTFYLVSYYDDALFYPYTHAGLIAQGASEAEALFWKIRTLWDKTPDNIKSMLNLTMNKQNKRELGFSNNSIMFIRLSFRSTTLHRLHVSEMGKIANESPDRVREIKTGTLQAIHPSNPTVIESTAEGHNEFRNMWTGAMSRIDNLSPKDFYPVFLPWMLDNTCKSNVDEQLTKKQEEYFKQVEIDTGYKLTKEQKNFWVAQHRELGNDIKQEYPSTWEEAFIKDTDGAYYAKLYIRLIINRKRVINNLYERDLPVQVAMDIGKSGFAIVFFQTYTDGFRIIDEYYNRNESLAHYGNHLLTRQSSYGRYSKIIVPHDAKVKELSTMMSRIEILENLGLENIEPLKKTAEVAVDREIVKANMNKIWVDDKLIYIPDCFLNYRAKKNKATGLLMGEHVNDDYAHGADAIRYMILGGDTYSEPKTVSHTYDGYDIG